MKNSVSTDEQKRIQEETEAQIKGIWERFETLLSVSDESVYSVCKKIGISQSAIYDAINAGKLNRPAKNTDAFLLVQLAEQLGVPLDTLVYGAQYKAEETNEKSNLADTIFTLSKGNLATILLLSLPYLKPEQIEAVRADIISRFEH